MILSNLFNYYDLVAYNAAMITPLNNVFRPRNVECFDAKFGFILISSLTFLGKNNGFQNIC